MSLDNLSAWDEAFDAKTGDEAETPEQKQERETAAAEQEAEAKLAADAEEAEKEASLEGKKEAPDEDTDTENDGKTEKEAKPGARDLTKFAEEDRPFLKQMSRQAFDHISNKLLSMAAVNKEQADAITQANADRLGGKTLPDAWYNDPAAAEASPEFKEARVEFDKAQAETHRLTSILEQYESGEITYNPATNTFIPNNAEEPVAPSARLIRQLSDARMQAFEAQKVAATKGNAVQESFGRIYKQSEQNVSDTVKRLFPWTSDDKHENQKHFKDVHGNWPKPFQGHPVAKLASALAVEHIKLKAAHKETLEKLKAAESLKTARRQAGPVPGRNGRVNGSDLEKKLTLSDFD